MKPRFFGFTVVELSVVLAVMAIIATPSFLAWHLRDQVDARARALFSTLSLARSEAVKRGARVTLCRIDVARHCLAPGKNCGSGAADWSCGWALFVERDGAPVLLRAQPASPSIAIAGATTDLSFTPPAGQVIGGFRSFDFSARNSRLAASALSARCIRLATGGRARMTQGGCGAAA
ncbi:type IV fimbrial biogenesis protein FimT [Caballeronia arationis]|jgi:type IV fimbrial biogenesis protein FimT|uniref:Type II secretion system protein H n=1 Tax=Caballeronia arationis TaxID=1777142 RepID=A0A7Z7N508_9BURK|nr:type IV fimbrial biogenesis protein FimT [Caballeronia arationis]